MQMDVVAHDRDASADSVPSAQVPQGTLWLAFPPPSCAYHWFSRGGCVLRGEGDERRVFVGGTLIGTFGPRERPVRNALLIALSASPEVHLGKLCEAFGVSDETLRRLRQLYRSKGIEAVLAHGPKGSKSLVTPTLRARIERLRDKGLSLSQVRDQIKGAVSRTTIARVRGRSARAKAETSAAVESAPAEVAVDDVPMAAAQLSLPPGPEAPSEAVTVSPCATSETPASAGAETAATADGDRDETEATKQPEGCGSPADEPPPAPPADDERKGADAVIATSMPVSARLVQHLGTWLMLAIVARLGLYKYAADVASTRAQQPGAVRLAIDAAICALTIGQRCIEGVRRLATPSASTLLRAHHAPSATWVRRVLGGIARELGGFTLHYRMACEYIRADVADTSAHEPVVFYVDNHTRRYTGHHVLRKAWRMQDKKAVPGATDYYVHDQDGRSLLRIDVASNAPLTQWLLPVAKILRDAVGPDQRILLGFDRAGA